jgi:AraC-like DNA-binding protein
MDALAGFLDGPRARGAFLLRSLLEPPWSLRIQDEAPLSLIAVVRGPSWYLPDGGDAVELRDGDVAIVKGPEPYTFADAPTTLPQVVIHPGEHCTDLAGNPLTDAMGLGVRTWGNHPEGRVVLLTGTYLTDGEISRPLLDALPTAIVVRRDEWDTPLVGLLADEIARDRPGDQAVLDRLLDLLLIAALRQWASRPGSQPPGWYRAQTDPVVGPALRLLHDDPAAEWTVARLAAAVGISRAACARRFTELVGVPPMTYLTRWRLALAADLLQAPGATVGQVAARVGYTSPFTFSTAFKRHYGVSPRRHRERQPA